MLTRKLAPQLVEQPGVGPHAAAQLVLSRSHQGRITSEAAFARLAGAAPIPASSGQTIRYRLDRSGDRKLNRALHMILVTRKRTHPATISYIERRFADGKTRRETNRCLKRYLARNLYRLLEHPPIRLTLIEASPAQATPASAGVVGSYSLACSGTTSRNFAVSMNCRNCWSFPSRTFQTCTAGTSSFLPVALPVPV
jgi:hypothetical protein